MIAVVTGATGHVGNNLVRELCARGQRVRVLLQDQASAKSLSGLELERVRGDVRDVSSLEVAFADADVVYHLAAQISIADGDDGSLEATNVGGTANVVQACLRRGVRRLVHMSSVHALSAFPADRPIDETRPLVDVRAAAYDRSKAAGERAVLAGVERGLDAVIVSPAAVLGPNDYGPSLQGESLLAMTRSAVPVTVAGAYNWVDVRDVVAGTLAAARQGRRGERYLLSGHLCTVRELALRLAAHGCGRAPLLTLPHWCLRLGLPLVSWHAERTESRPLYTRQALEILASNSDFRSDKARRELNFCCRPLDETVADAIAFYRTAGYL